MEANEKTLTLFTTRIRQLILQFKDMKKENADLYAMVDERDARISELEAKLAQAQNDYNSLKMARMIEISDGDLQGAKDRLSKLIREVNKCISMLQGDKA